MLDKLNKIIYYCIVLFFIFLVFNCSTTDKTETDDTKAPNSQEKAILDNGLITWKNTKNIYGNTYYYKRSFSSWVGFGNKTLIQIDNDEPKARINKAWDENNETSSWIENINTIGVNSGGYDALIIEILYAKCRDEILSKAPIENIIGLEIDDLGILLACYFRPKNCVDDCTHDISVYDFKFGNISQEEINLFLEQ